MITTEEQTNTQTLNQYNLDWTVDRRPLFIGHMGNTWTHEGTELEAINDTSSTLLESHVVNTRSDTNEILGVVGKNYQILQNEELLEIAQAVEDKTGAKIVDATSMRKGKDVFFQLSGSDFTLPGNDEVKAYRLYYNNHAGEKPNYWLDTTIRVVCENTLNAAIYEGKKEGIKIRHTMSMKDRIEETILALKESEELAKQFRHTCEYLASATRVNAPDYFEKVYSSAYGQAPDLIEEPAKHTRMINMTTQWMDNLSNDHHPTSMWTALNAVTEWADHKRTVRGEAKDDYEDSGSLRRYSNLFGTSADFKRKALDVAFEMVG